MIHDEPEVQVEEHEPEYEFAQKLKEVCPSVDYISAVPCKDGYKDIELVVIGTGYTFRVSRIDYSKKEYEDWEDVRYFAHLGHKPSITGDEVTDLSVALKTMFQAWKEWASREYDYAAINLMSVEQTRGK
jgi:hypothetical protein